LVGSAKFSSVDDAQLVVGNHHMFAVGGARDQPFVIGAEAGALLPFDVEVEIAIEQVAELNVGQGEVITAEIGGFGQLLLRNVEVEVEEQDRLSNRVRVSPPRGRPDDAPENRPGKIERDRPPNRWPTS
jgi:hypothetical protein